MKPEGGEPLSLGHLVVEEFHDVFFSAECIVDTVRAEDTGEQDAFTIASFGLFRHGTPFVFWISPLLRTI
jgi:hypothetical protein